MTQSKRVELIKRTDVSPGFIYEIVEVRSKSSCGVVPAGWAMVSVLET